MSAAADTFGSFGRYGHQTAGARAARIFDHVATWAMAIVLLLIGGLAGYSLWDSYQVVEGTDLTQYRPGGYGFAELLAMNPDVCAWLTVDNTGIDYPVVQGTDDFEYLDKDATGAGSAAGSLYLDSACDRNFGEPYEVIMGHHMVSHKMFGDLDLFLDESFFDSNKSAKLYLPHETLELEVDAVLTENAYDQVIFGTPAEAGQVAEVVQKAESSAVHYREGSLSPEDQIISFSTCSSDATDARTIVLCKMVDRYDEDNAGD